MSAQIPPTANCSGNGDRRATPQARRIQVRRPETRATGEVRVGWIVVGGTESSKTRWWGVENVPQKILPWWTVLRFWCRSRQPSQESVDLPWTRGGYPIKQSIVKNNWVAFHRRWKAMLTLEKGQIVEIKKRLALSTWKRTRQRVKECGPDRSVGLKRETVRRDDRGGEAEGGRWKESRSVGGKVDEEEEEKVRRERKRRKSASSQPVTGEETHRGGILDFWLTFHVVRPIDGRIDYRACRINLINHLENPDIPARLWIFRWGQFLYTIRAIYASIRDTVKSRDCQLSCLQRAGLDYLEAINKCSFLGGISMEIKAFHPWSGKPASKNRAVGQSPLWRWFSTADERLIPWKNPLVYVREQDWISDLNHGSLLSQLKLG